MVFHFIQCLEQVTLEYIIQPCFRKEDYERPFTSALLAACMFLGVPILLGALKVVSWTTILIGSAVGVLVLILLMPVIFYFLSWI